MDCTKRIFFGLIPITRHTWTPYILYYKSFPKEIYPNFWDDGTSHASEEYRKEHERRKCLQCGKIQDHEFHGREE